MWKKFLLFTDFLKVYVDHGIHVLACLTNVPLYSFCITFSEIFTHCSPFGSFWAIEDSSIWSVCVCARARTRGEGGWWVRMCANFYLSLLLISDDGNRNSLQKLKFYSVLVWLIAWENFIAFNHHENFSFYIFINFCYI